MKLNIKSATRLNKDQSYIIYVYILQVTPFHIHFTVFKSHEHVFNNYG